jgi:hypothetical protein
VVHVAADRPGVGLHRHVVEDAPVEDPFVGPEHDPVGLAQAVVVPVEGVRVLHEELAGAQHAEARPQLVAVLPVDLVQVQRQVAVRAVLLGDEGCHDLLRRGREAEPGFLAVV